MAEQPTDEQKLAAAKTALEGIQPPVPETIVTERLAEVVVAIVWSQLALVPPAIAAAPSPNGEAEAPKGPWPPMYAELLYTNDPVLTERIKIVLAEQASISEEIRKDRIEDAGPT